MKTVHLYAEGWEPVFASHATTFRERLLGGWLPTARKAVLIETRSVHTIGRSNGLSLVAIDSGSRVIGTRTLPPNRITIFARASRILELPEGSPLPAIGARINIDDV